MGATGVQVDAVGDLDPRALGDTGRRELRNLLKSYGQDLAALNVPLRNGLDVFENQQPRLDHIRGVMQLAFDLGAWRVVVPFPRIPEDEASPKARVLRESLLALGSYGDRVGTVVAAEIGYDPSEKVKQYFASFETGSLQVTYDPANMMLHGHDPIANLTPLKELLAHVHARDARNAGVSKGIQEVPLGAGDIDWMSFTVTLQVLEFDGFLTVEREQGENKLADITNGIAFLRRFTGQMTNYQ
jgi:sugar phosphate isomerase/epimerase